MRRFKNILVAVDLSHGDHLVSSNLSPPTIEAIERAVWLAKLNSARLVFFSTLDICPDAQRRIEQAGDDRTLVTDATEVLAGLVRQAREDGVEAASHVQFGKSWLGIIQHAVKNKFDLVVAGTRHLGSMKGLLIGSTGIKLLRKCPIPVWITRPQTDTENKSILVAHCLRPVGDTAMELGCSLAQLLSARLHVLHSLEFPETDSALPTGVPSETVDQRRVEANRHIDSQLAKFDLVHPPQVHIVKTAADAALLRVIEKQEIGLLVMGTIARTGIAGFITGNTAERLLPQIPCSVLAVKPEGFISPVAS